jgi:tight adherence protein C
MTFLDLVTVGAFFILAMLVFLIGDFVAGGRRTARRLAGAKNDLTGLLSEPGKKTSVFVQAMAAVVPQLSSEVDVIRRNLMRAGYYSTHALQEYLATRNTLVVACIAATLAFATLADPGSQMPRMILVTGAIATACGYGLPRLLLAVQARSRVDRIQIGLPDALDIITMCLTGGLPLRDALQRVADEIKFSNRDVAVEFEIIRRHADADTMANALRHFASRIDTPDINALATLVSQTHRMGSHISTAVCDYADSVRRTRRQRAEEDASKTSIRMLFPVLLCLAPPIYILLMGPPILQLKNFVQKEHQPGGALEPAVPRMNDAPRTSNPQNRQQQVAATVTQP